MADSPTLQGLIDRMAKGNTVRAKHVRKAIDREGVAKNTLYLDGEFKKRYEAFRKVAQASEDKGFEFEGNKFTKGAAKKIVNTVEGTGEASERLTYREMGEKNRDLMGKLFNDLQGIVEAGHRDTSIMKTQMALLLNSIPKEDPRRPALRALFVVTEQIDKITKSTDLSLEGIMSKHRDIIESDYDITASVNITVDAMTGIKGEVPFTLENKAINQDKGRKLSAPLGKRFQKVIQGDLKSFEKLFNGYDISRLKGSPTVKDHLASQFRDIVDPKSKHKKAFIKKGNKKSISKGNKAKSTTLASASLTKFSAPRKKARSKQPNTQSPIALLSLINQKLPKTVLANMRLPRLESQSGRFAASVSALDIYKTPRGYPSIGYTYEKEPYGVFESTSGSRFASIERDPRSLIEGSIREIAAELAIGRFYTRRI